MHLRTSFIGLFAVLTSLFGLSCASTKAVDSNSTVAAPASGPRELLPDASVEVQQAVASIAARVPELPEQILLMTDIAADSMNATQGPTVDRISRPQTLKAALQCLDELDKQPDLKREYSQEFDKPRYYNVLVHCVADFLTKVPTTAQRSTPPAASSQPPPGKSAADQQNTAVTAEDERNFRGAAMTGDVKFLQSLVSKGIKVDAKDPANGSTALSLAVDYGELAAVKFLLKNDAYANAQIGSGVTLLHLAARQKDPQFMRLLLEAGADPNRRTDLSLTSPLMEAVESDNLAVIPLLLKHGANIQAKDMLGEDVLMQIRERAMKGEDNPKLLRMASVISAEARRQGIRLYK